MNKKAKQPIKKRQVRHGGENSLLFIRILSLNGFQRGAS